MFERKKYKNFAKKQLSGRWGIPIAITLIVGAISVLFSLPEWFGLVRSGYFSSLFNGDYYSALEASEAASSVSYVSSLISMAASAILEVAVIGVYIKMSRSPEPVSFSDFLDRTRQQLRRVFQTAIPETAIPS